MITAAKDADVILVGTDPHTTRKVLEALPKLKMAGRSGVGVDSIDLEAATELGICVTNTRGINMSEVADHAMAMLSITRQIVEQNEALKAGAWSDRPAEVEALREKLRRKGVCYNNAVAEAFRKSLKVEAIHGENFETTDDAKVAIFEYIEVYYNRIRRHSTLNYLSPHAFEMTTSRLTE